MVAASGDFSLVSGAIPFGCFFVELSEQRDCHSLFFSGGLVPEGFPPWLELHQTAKNHRRRIGLFWFEILSVVWPSTPVVGVPMLGPLLVHRDPPGGRTEPDPSSLLLPLCERCLPGLSNTPTVQVVLD